MGTNEIGVVRDLWRYPVSSLGGERLDTAEVAETGLCGDRAWGLADASTGEPAAPERAKRWRPAALLNARSTPDTPEIAVPGAPWIPCTSERARTAVSEYLGFDVDVLPEKAGSDVGTEEGIVLPRYERAAVHVLTTAALARLLTLLPPASDVDPRRFRPNIVVATADGVTGFAELDWAAGGRLEIGDAVLRVNGPCGRCSFPTLEQPGLPHDKLVLQAIARSAGGRFGVLCDVVESGSISSGDPVRLGVPRH